MPSLSSLAQRMRQYGQPIQPATDTTAPSVAATATASTPAYTESSEQTSRLRAGVYEFVQAMAVQIRTAGGLRVKGIPIPMAALDGLIAAAMRQLDAVSDEQLEGFARMTVSTIQGLLDDDSGPDSNPADERAATADSGLRDDSDSDRWAGRLSGQNGQWEVRAGLTPDSALARESTEPQGSGDRQQATVSGVARTQRPPSHTQIQEVAAGGAGSAIHRAPQRGPRARRHAANLEPEVQHSGRADTEPGIH